MLIERQCEAPEITLDNCQSLAARLGRADLDRSQLCVLDIECWKVPAPPDWVQRTRFQTFMVGIGYFAPHLHAQLFASESEAALFARIAPLLSTFTYGLYSATRDFDRVVLEGRWVNARRAHAERAGDWPILRMPSEWWINVRHPLRHVTSRCVDRQGDIPSQDIAGMSSLDDPRMEQVWTHNWLDLQDLGWLVSAA